MSFERVLRSPRYISVIPASIIRRILPLSVPAGTVVEKERGHIESCSRAEYRRNESSCRAAGGGITSRIGIKRSVTDNNSKRALQFPGDSRGDCAAWICLASTGARPSVGYERPILEVL